ncbi:unnamed protein product, partial [Tenebrio molitor]
PPAPLLDTQKPLCYLTVAKRLEHKEAADNSCCRTKLYRSLAKQSTWPVHLRSLPPPTKHFN